MRVQYRRSRRGPERRVHCSKNGTRFWNMFAPGLVGSADADPMSTHTQNQMAGVLPGNVGQGTVCLEGLSVGQAW